MLIKPEESSGILISHEVCLKMRLIFLILFMTSCKSTSSSLKLADLKRGFENEKVEALWNEHIVKETQTNNTAPNKALQDECFPKFFPSKSEDRKGMVMLLHGFTACPQQFYDIANMLSTAGFDVFVPLLPGQGRKPSGDKDYLDDLPGQTTGFQARQHEDYISFVSDMNGIAEASTGLKVIAGLSGGGGLATGAVVTGQKAERNIWDRALLYAPYYLNPGVVGAATDILAAIPYLGGTKSDWGDACRVNRSVEKAGGRDGYCSVTAQASQAMVQYGYVAAQSIDKVKIPMQFVGVEHDPTADNQQIWKAFKAIKDATGKAAFCLYPKGVPHSIINPAQDLIPDLEEYQDLRGKDTPSGPPYEWVAPMQKHSVDFIERGTWFPTNNKKSKLEERYFAADLCLPDSLDPNWNNK